MLAHINLYNLVFIDIETVPQYPRYEDAPEAVRELWAIKHSSLKAGNETPEEGYLTRAGVYAEFAKVVCVSLGFMHFDIDKKIKYLRLKSFYGDDEKILLASLATTLSKSFTDSERYHFCGHNIREFDIPFVCRRMIVNRILLPEMFDFAGKRPWEMQDVDTLQLWKFGDYKSYTSLKLLTHILDIPTPKDDIDGKDVCRVYWQEKDLERIVTYCQKDVVTVARLLMRLKGDTDFLHDDQVVLVK